MHVRNELDVKDEETTKRMRLFFLDSNIKLVFLTRNQRHIDIV